MAAENFPKSSEESMSAATATKQRKKRKWDQPAESLISAGLAVPGALPLGMGGLLPGTVPAACTTVPQLFQAPVIQQSTAAIIQKLTQPKIQDELISREIVINDAESTVRYRLTKRQTQEEIQKSTGAVVITRGKYRPPNGFPDNEKPLYLHISAGAHLKDTAERIKAVDRAASMIEEILKQGLILHSANTGGQVTQLVSTCVFLGFDPDPSLNIAARIRGPNDQYISHIMNVTGANVVLRGQGLENSESLPSDEAQQPLHLYLSTNNTRSLEEARILAENLMDTICVECGASRKSSSKVYSAVPPPQQLLVGVGVQSSKNEFSVNSCPATSSAIVTITTSSASSSFSPIPATCTSANQYPPGTVVHPGIVYSQPQPNLVSYPQTSVTGGTSYSGYDGIYPQATPLQQVALALRQAPASNPSAPFYAHTPAASSPLKMNLSKKTNTNSSAETDRRPQRRKFQESPAASSGPSTAHQNLCQEPDFLKAGSRLDAVGTRNISSMPPPKQLMRPSSNGLLPPPPRNMPPPPPRNMNPPPPPVQKFTAPQSPPKSKSNNSPPKKSTVERVPDPLMKLMDYGEEDEDAIDGDNEDFSKTKTESTGITTGKPFWAV